MATENFDVPDGGTGAISPSVPNQKRDGLVSAGPLLYSDLTEKIIGAAIAVHKELGPGFLEKVYETALTLEFSLRNLPFRQQAPIDVRYKGRLVGHYVADLLVDEKSSAS